VSRVGNPKGLLARVRSNSGYGDGSDDECARDDMSNTQEQVASAGFDRSRSRRTS